MAAKSMFSPPILVASRETDTESCCTRRRHSCWAATLTPSSGPTHALACLADKAPLARANLNMQNPNDLHTPSLAPGQKYNENLSAHTLAFAPNFGAKQIANHDCIRKHSHMTRRTYSSALPPTDYITNTSSYNTFMRAVLQRTHFTTATG